MKNSLAALLADDKARVLAIPEYTHGSARSNTWTFKVRLMLKTDNGRNMGIIEYEHLDDIFPTRSDAELAGEALRDKAKEQVNR